MKYAAIYIRVSTDEQARHGFSLGEQEADLKRYAARRGYLIYDVYADEGVSARRKMSRRHELQRLLDDIRQDHIDIVLVKCLDRWFRNVADFYEVQKILDAHHVGFECSQEQYNTTTTNGRLMLNLMLSIAQNESDQTADRIKYVHDGLHRKKLETGGKFPLGYKRVNNRLVIDTEQRPIVDFIFRRRLEGYSVQRIAREVWEKFHFAITGQRVYKSLHNRTYIGERYGIADFCPAIIDDAVFQQIQALPKQKQSRKKQIHLFSGKIICPSCGHPFTTNGIVSKTQYYCNAKYTKLPHSAAACRNIYVHERVLEKFLLQNIRRFLTAYKIEWTSASNRRADAEAKKVYLQQKSQRLKALFIDGVIDHSEFQQKYKDIMQELQMLEATAARSKKMPKSMLNVLSQQNFASVYQNLSYEKKHDLWQSLIERIDIGDTPFRRGIPYTDFKVTFYH